MKIWRNSKLDSLLFLFSILDFSYTLFLLLEWDALGVLGKQLSLLLLIMVKSYNIIVVSHLFTHTPWFKSKILNSFVSILNSINIGQSVQSYHLTHVRNHHKYNNDRKDKNNTTRDNSSTFKEGINGEHSSLWKYSVFGAVITFFNIVKTDILSISRMWRVGDHELNLWSLTSRSKVRQKNELRQIQQERIFHFLFLVFLVCVSWKWTLLFYLPAFLLSLVLVNIQNYYEHFGACPENRMANSVSYYGFVYNLLTFNDGYHQEHHLFAAAHWKQMPKIRKIHFTNTNNLVDRIISPVPAIVGFLDFNRKMLHRLTDKQIVKPNLTEVNEELS